MKSKQISFFSVQSDIEPILKYIENSVSIHYFQMGLLDTSNIPHYNTAFEIPNLGFVQKGDWNQVDSFLVLSSSEHPKVRDILQKAGGVKFAVDQMLNEKSIELKPGGVYKDGVIVAGRVATISEDDFSVMLFKLFSSSIKKQFTKIGTFYVGNNAEQKLKSGWRLVTNEKSPKEYDLSLS